MTNNIKDIATEDLQQHRANAQYTFGWCTGHTKARMNQTLISQYDKELAERGLKPDESIEGVFNGEGST
jgi:hypothetical protein